MLCSAGPFAPHRTVPQHHGRARVPSPAAHAGPRTGCDAGQRGRGGGANFRVCEFWPATCVLARIATSQPCRTGACCVCRLRDDPPALTLPSPPGAPPPLPPGRPFPSHLQPWSPTWDRSPRGIAAMSGSSAHANSTYAQAQRGEERGRCSACCCEWRTYHDTLTSHAVFSVGNVFAMPGAACAPRNTGSVPPVPCTLPLTPCSCS